MFEPAEGICSKKRTSSLVNFFFISLLLETISKHPFEGIGKPEKLKHELNGYWSRRIDVMHRMVYTVTDDKIYVISCRYHYKKSR
ncbi:MAG: Txe/YoeB family addiction module toxin [Tannerellaceae bacterium]|jgi:Txe/YoeB family toxin of toxin-antitoxin system|nr:Txe/YoeB family addiction module toxin [Tannerellaceae bacterium]